MKMKGNLEKYLDEIRSGFHTFTEVGHKSVKQELAGILLEDYKKGVITDEAKKSLADYYIDEINKNRMSLDDVPDFFRDEVSKVYNK